MRQEERSAASRCECEWGDRDPLTCQAAGRCLSDSAATTTRPTLVGPLPKFPKVRCDSCGQIYVSTVVVVVPTTKPCPNCGGGSFSASFDSRPLGAPDA